MPVKRAVPDAQDLIDRYQRGEPMRQLLIDRGISDCLFGRLLRDHGVKRRSTQECRSVKTGRASPLRWSPESPEDILQAYHSGESVKAISDRIGVSRQAIGDWMKRQGIKPRNRNQAELLKWSRIKQDRAAVERQCQAAWRESGKRGFRHLDDALSSGLKSGKSTMEIARELGVSKPFVKKRLRELGFDLSEQAAERKSRGIQMFASDGMSNTCMVSPIEIDILHAVRVYHPDAIHQFALGPRNLDIAIESARVAIEIERRRFSDSKSLRSERLEYLLDREHWNLIVVYLTRNRSAVIDVSEIAKRIHAFVELSSSDPSVRGQYGVIGRNGQTLTQSRDYFNNRTRVPGF